MGENVPEGVEVEIKQTTSGVSCPLLGPVQISFKGMLYISKVDMERRGYLVPSFGNSRSQSKNQQILELCNYSQPGSHLGRAL